MKVTSLYHVGIPVDDIDRARDFYTNVLGMQFLDRVGGDPNNPDALEIHGKVQRLDRLRCGDSDVVLFERPRQLKRDALDEDGIANQACNMGMPACEETLKKAKALGKFHRIVERKSGKTIYMFDTEGNYLALHFPAPRQTA